MDWLKNNAVGIIFGIISCAGIIGAFINGLYSVICSGPFEFWVWSIAVGMLFGSLGWAIRNRQAKWEIKDLQKQLDHEKKVSAGLGRGQDELFQKVKELEDINVRANEKINSLESEVNRLEPLQKLEHERIERILGMTPEEAAEKLASQQKRIGELGSDKPPVVDAAWVRAACKLLSDAQKAELYQAYLIGEGFDPNYEGFRSAGKLTSCRLLQKHGLREYDVHPAAVQAINADGSLKDELVQAWEGSRFAF